MVLKIFKAVWFLSVLAVLGNLLFIYASLPEDVVVQNTEAGTVSLNREVFFYIALAVLALVNVLVYAVAKVFARDEDFRAWFHGLEITLNIFFIVAFSLTGLYNSSENFDYSNIGFVIYGSVGLIVCWAISWPVYKIFNKTGTKQAV